MQREFSTFHGIDLGGGKGKRTGVARLVRAGDGVVVEEVGLHDGEGKPWYDDRLLAHLRRYADGAVVGIDAPLTLTACVRCAEPVCPGLASCTDPAVAWFREVGDPQLRRRNDEAGRFTNGKPLSTPYTQRPTELWLVLERGIQPRETLGQGMGPLTARARHLCLALRPQFELNRNLLEVYPKATVHSLFPQREFARYRHDPEVRQHILHRLPDLRFGSRTRFGRQHAAEIDHCFDAVISAYTAYLWARDGWTIPPDHDGLFARDGWIWVPPPAAT